MLFELFFSGSWQAIEFGLAIIGALTLGKIIYDVLLEARIKRKEKEEADKIKEKYFN
jgi:hypothetical protein